MSDRPHITFDVEQIKSSDGEKVVDLRGNVPKLMQGFVADNRARMKAISVAGVVEASAGVVQEIMGGNLGRVTNIEHKDKVGESDLFNEYEYVISVKTD